MSNKIMNPQEWLQFTYFCDPKTSQKWKEAMEAYAAHVAAHARQETARQAVEIIRQHVFAVEGLHTADELCNSIMALTSGAGEKTGEDEQGTYGLGWGG